MLPNSDQSAQAHLIDAEAAFMNGSAKHSWEDGDSESGLRAYVQETKRILPMAGPICLQSALAFSSSLVSLAFAGHLGSLALSQAVLASSCYNITGCAVLLGMAAGMETLCGQAYGAGNFTALGTTLQLAVFISTLMFCGIFALWTQIGPVLLFAGQNREIVEGAVRYLLLSAPALYGYTINECLKRYLLAQGVVQPATVIMAVSAALAPLYNWALVTRSGLGLGLDGAALANGAVQATSALALVLYCRARDRGMRGTPHQTWPGWTAASLKAWRPYMAMALPSIAACCLEWWLYEGLILLAGWLPDPDVAVAVMGIGFNTTALTYTISMGVAGAASTRVGNELGRGRADRAERAARTASVLEAALMVAVCTAGIAARNVWGRLFTDDPKVLSALAAVLPLVFFSELGDGANCVCGGIMRGAGRQLLASVLNLGTYWGLGLPLAVVLGWRCGLGVAGLWWGLAITTSVQGLAMQITVLLFDWELEAKRTAALLQAQAAAVGDALEPLLPAAPGLDPAPSGPPHVPFGHPH